MGTKTAYIEPGSPWENGYIESFNARLRDELLNGEIFYTLREAQIIIESWRRHYNADPPRCLARLQTTSTGGLRARVIRVAGCATPAGSAGHAGVSASSQLTFQLDHSMQAGQCSRNAGRESLPPSGSALLKPRSSPEAYFLRANSSSLWINSRGQRQVVLECLRTPCVAFDSGSRLTSWRGTGDAVMTASDAGRSPEERTDNRRAAKECTCGTQLRLFLDAEHRRVRCLRPHRHRG